MVKGGGCYPSNRYRDHDLKNTLRRSKSRPTGRTAKMDRIFPVGRVDLALGAHTKSNVSNPGALAPALAHVLEMLLAPLYENAHRLLPEMIEAEQKAWPEEEAAFEARMAKKRRNQLQTYKADKKKFDNGKIPAEPTEPMPDDAWAEHVEKERDVKRKKSLTLRPGIISHDILMYAMKTPEYANLVAPDMLPSAHADSLISDNMVAFERRVASLERVTRGKDARKRAIEAHKKRKEKRAKIRTARAARRAAREEGTNANPDKG